jgi:hypothetical protein
LEKLNFHTLHIRRRHSDPLFILSVYNDGKCCPSLLGADDIPVPDRNIRNFTMSSRSFTHRPSATCASAAKAVSKSTNIFGKLRLI